MSLGLVSPILNRGVRSRWVSTLPAGSKMLTIDAAGDVSYTDIPTAAWGSITGTLSSQTDLQNALNAKLSLSGGTMTGIGSAGTSTLRVNAGSGSSFTQINDNGTVVIDSDSATGTFPLTLKYAGTTVASVSYQGTITGAIGAFSSLSLDSGFVILDTDATNVLAQRSSTAAQAYRIYNTFTNASNYERAKIAWESNVLRIGTEAAGTGTSRNVELQAGGSTVVTLAAGGATFSGAIATSNSGIVISECIIRRSSASGIIEIADNSENFKRLQLGGRTSSYPAIKRNGTAINFRLADDSADAGITASTATFSGRATISEYIVTSVHNEIVAGADGSGYYFGCGLGSGTQPSFIGVAGAATSVFVGGTTGSLFLRGKKLAFRVSDALGGQLLQAESSTALSLIDSTNAQTFRVYNTYTDASNYERGKIEWSSNVLRIGTEKAGTGSARALELQTDGTTRLTIATNGNITGAGLTLDNSNSQNIGLDVRPWITIKNNSATLAGYLSNGGSIFSSGASGTTDLGLRAVGAFGISVNNSQTPTITISSTSLVTIADASDIAVGTTTGTKIGTATTQKIGFYNATPVVQPAAVADATDAASVITQLNLLLSRMRDLGLIAT